MDEKLKALHERFEAKSGELDAIIGRGAGITQEDIAKGEAINAELDGIKSEIERLSQLAGKVAEHKRFVNTPAGTAQFVGATKDSEVVVAASGEQFSGADGEPLLDRKTLAHIGTAEYKRTFMEYLRKGLNPLSGAQVKTLQEAADPSGGFLVPEDILARIVMKKPTPSRVAGYVSRMVTSRDALVIPRVNYTSDDLYTTGIRSTWTGETPASASVHRATDPVYGQLRVPIYTNMMSLPLTNDLIEDALFPLASWVSERFSETIELLRDNMILTGSSVGQPTGILSNPGGSDQPAVVAMGNPITADGVVKLPWSLPEQYDTNARWVMNKTSMGQYVALLKDSQNRYLWGNGYQDSGMQPGGLGNGERNLDGYPVNFSGFMPNIGANAYPAIFGDFSGYYLIDRVGFSIQVLRELYAETNQIVLLGRVRFGGQVAEPWKLKIGQQA